MGKRRLLSAVLAEDPISHFQAWLPNDCLARNLASEPLGDYGQHSALQ